MSGSPITVVVATRDRPAFLADCLGSLQTSVRPGDEVIVVDSFSTTTETADVSLRFGVRLLRCEQPGASLARNRGWQAASHELVAFVDDDVQVAPEWASAVASVMDGHPETDFVTGRLGVLPEESDAERPVAFFDEAAPFIIDRDMVDGLGHGANLAVRRSALAATGGYDEKLGPGTRWPAAEDLDLLDRLLLSGRQGRYEPSVSAVHRQWRDKRNLLRLEWSYGVGQGGRLARLKRRDAWRYRRVNRLVWRQAGVSALAECVRSRYEFGVVSIVVRLAGTALGRSTAALSAVRSGRPDRTAR